MDVDSSNIPLLIIFLNNNASPMKPYRYKLPPKLLCYTVPLVKNYICYKTIFYCYKMQITKATLMECSRIVHDFQPLCKYTNGKG